MNSEVIHNPLTGITGRFADVTLQAFGSTLGRFLSVPSLVYALATALVVIAAIAGARLSRFRHPDRPLFGRVVRHFGLALKLSGWLCVFLTATAAMGLTLLLATGATARALSAGGDVMPSMAHHFVYVWGFVREHMIAATAVGLTTGLIGSGLLVYFLIPAAERGQELIDRAFMTRLFARTKAFDPASFINLRKGLFVGLEDGKHATFIPWKNLRETHMQVLGSSGGGKGITLALLGSQFIRAGEATIVFDPKGDERLCTTLARAAQTAKVGFRVLDLNPTAPVQFNLLEGAKAHEIEELLVAGLRLQPSDGDGDYYRGVDQDAAADVAREAAAATDASLPDLLATAATGERFADANNFVRRLRQVGELPAIQTRHGIGIASLIDRGDVLYVRGSTDNHRVKMLQTMLLVRVLQIIKSRPESEDRRPVALLLDEFKHLLSTVSLDMLGVVRAFGAHAVLAHQSLGDFGAVPGLRREDVEPIVSDNTSLKLVFRIGDPETAVVLAQRSGLERTQTESLRGIDEHGLDARAWTSEQQSRIAEDVFTHLHRPSDGQHPLAAGVLFGVGSAKLIAVAPLRSVGEMPTPVPAPSELATRPSSPSEAI